MEVPVKNKIGTCLSINLTNDSKLGTISVQVTSEADDLESQLIVGPTIRPYVCAKMHCDACPDNGELGFYGISCCEGVPFQINVT